MKLTVSSCPKEVLIVEEFWATSVDLNLNLTFEILSY